MRVRIGALVLGLLGSGCVDFQSELEAYCFRTGDCICGEAGCCVTEGGGCGAGECCGGLSCQAGVCLGGERAVLTLTPSRYHFRLSASAMDGGVASAPFRVTNVGGARTTPLQLDIPERNVPFTIAPGDCAGRVLRPGEGCEFQVLQSRYSLGQDSYSGAEPYEEAFARLVVLAERGGRAEAVLEAERGARLRFLPYGAGPEDSLLLIPQSDPAHPRLCERTLDGTPCEKYLFPTERVTLRARHGGQPVPVRWSVEACPGQVPECTFVLEGDIDVVADFTAGVAQEG